MSPQETTDFWSRRKAAVQVEAEAEQSQKKRCAENADAERLRSEQVGKSDGEILQELGLPDPESLSAGDDFAAFLGKAVPEHLRRRALRQLWGSNPVLANLDGLVDYGEDFTLGSVAAGALKTVYQVGRGAVAQFDEMTAETPAPSEDASEAKVDGMPATPPRPSDRPEIPDAQSAAPIIMPPRPRHMQFTFTDEVAT